MPSMNPVDDATIESFLNLVGNVQTRNTCGPYKNALLAKRSTIDVIPLTNGKISQVIPIAIRNTILVRSLFHGSLLKESVPIIHAIGTSAKAITSLPKNSGTEIPDC